jgi:O-acetyl-ADP-ribose deacetylase (regulator of RNase III)
MIRYTQGNLLEASADALVNTVNEVGVMGKGIALQFRDAFPASARAYEQEAKAGRVRIGAMFVTEGASLLGPRLIIHFPTKKHWRQPSQLAWIREGLADLVRVVKREGIRSIALPPLGCGNGGLNWALVRPEIDLALSAIPNLDVTVYEPTDAYLNAPKRSGVEELTSARALVAELVRRYAVLGLECSILEVQKLAWFLDRSIRRRNLPDVLTLEFTAQKFGPYSDRLRFLLDNLDGSYLHCERRLADAKPLDVIWFDGSHGDYLSDYLSSGASDAYLPALDEASSVIRGFESPLCMELLATVDWVISREHAEQTVAGVRASIGMWPAGRASAERKQRIFSDRLIGLALDRLTATVLA